MSREIWDDMLMEKGFIQVPRALRLKRAELGLTNNEYTILLDYVDYYTFSRTENPYRHLSEVNGMSERSIRKALAGIEAKGLLKRRVIRRPSGMISGVVFSVEPLVRKLARVMKKGSPAEGEGIAPGAGEEVFMPSTRDELKKKDEGKNTRAGRAGLENGQPECSDERGFDTKVSGGDEGTHRGNESGIGRPGGKASQIQSAARDGGPFPASFSDHRDAARAQEKKSRGGEHSPSDWYDAVFAPMYEAASGQPVLRGGREYRAAATYFRRLSELNPGISPEGLYVRAAEGAAFMIGSQVEGGVFGWMHKPPDVCALAGQAQAVDYHLRKLASGGHGHDNTGADGVKLSFIERIEEVRDAREQDRGVFSELRGIERAARRRPRPGEGRPGLRAGGVEGVGGEAEASHARGALVPGRRRAG